MGLLDLFSSKDEDDAVVADEVTDDPEAGTRDKLELEDAAELTDSGTKETQRAWHGARDDAEMAGELERGSGSGEEHPDEKDVSAQPLGGLGSIAELFGGSVGQDSEDEDKPE